MTDELRHIRRRLLLILILAPLFAGLLVYVAVSDRLMQTVSSELSRLGQSSATQLADRIAPMVVDGDILSLNVLVTRLTRDEPLTFIAIYDESDQLIAQSGKDVAGHSSFTTEVTFQDSVVGRVRITLAQPRADVLMVNAGLLIAYIAYLLVVLRFSTSITSWLLSNPAVPSATPQQPEDEQPAIEPMGPSEECILVVRIRPARHLENHFDRFFEAASLYGGIVEQTTPEELVIHFDSPDAMYMATCTGLLIQEITNRLSGNISFGGTLDLLTEEPEKIRKAASYLASIAEGDLVIAGGESLLSDRVELQSFHHALVDSNNLLRITGLFNPEVLHNQASHLATQS